MQLRDSHESLTEPVLTTPIAAIAPIRIVRCVLDNRRVSGRQKGLPQFGVLAELGEDSLKIGRAHV